MKIKHNIPNVRNMQSSNGNDVPNQFMINNVTVKVGNKNHSGVIFQSYSSVIVFQSGNLTILDERYWDYSVTTSKYRNSFLNETKKDTERKIKSGEYILANLNG